MSNDGQGSNVVDWEERDAIVLEASHRLKDAQERAAEWFTRKDTYKPDPKDLVTVTLPAGEWLYMQDALTRSRGDLLRNVLRLAYRYTLDGMPRDFDMSELSNHYVEAIRFRRLYLHISQTLIERRNLREADGDDD